MAKREVMREVDFSGIPGGRVREYPVRFWPHEGFLQDTFHTAGDRISVFRSNVSKNGIGSASLKGVSEVFIAARESRVTRDVAFSLIGMTAAAVICNFRRTAEPSA